MIHIHLLFYHSFGIHLVVDTTIQWKEFGSHSLQALSTMLTVPSQCFLIFFLFQVRLPKNVSLFLFFRFIRYGKQAILGLSSSNKVQSSGCVLNGKRKTHISRKRKTKVLNMIDIECCLENGLKIDIFSTEPLKVWSVMTPNCTATKHCRSK